MEDPERSAHFELTHLIFEMERAEGLKQVAQVRAEIYNPGVYN